MGLDELMNALGDVKSVRNHPDWPAFTEEKIPAAISFSYTNKDGHESYWDNAHIIKLKVDKLILVIEGEHGDPLNFDILKIRDAKDYATGKKVQHIFFELIRLWKDTHEE